MREAIHIAYRNLFIGVSQSVGLLAGFSQRSVERWHMGCTEESVGIIRVTLQE